MWPKSKLSQKNWDWPFTVVSVQFFGKHRDKCFIFWNVKAGTWETWWMTFLKASLQNATTAKERNICTCSCAKNIGYKPQPFALATQTIQGRFSWLLVIPEQHCVGLKEEKQKQFCHLCMRLAKAAKHQTTQALSVVVEGGTKPENYQAPSHE